MYEAVIDLIEIFENCSVDGEEVWCFKLIKDIIDGKVLVENISENKKKKAQMQINDSFEWLQSIGVTVKYKAEMIALIG